MYNKKEEKNDSLVRVICPICHRENEKGCEECSFCKSSLVEIETGKEEVKKS